MENKKSDTRDRELILSRTLNAPIGLVWEVWTNPEHIANWWGPNGFTNTINKMEVRPGGEWDLVMHGPDGTNYKNNSIFKEVIPFKKIVYEHVSAPKFVATVEFEDQGEKTLLTWHMLFETAEEFIRVVKTFKADEGLRQNGEKLEVYLKNLSKAGYAPVNGLEMYYEIHGDGGVPLVLIHGGGSTIESSFGRILPLLSGGRKVIAVELQAHGRTRDRDAPESFEQDADDVAGLLGYLNVATADFLGFSNGGTTTLQLAIRHPDIVNKIVVVAGAYKRDGFIPGFFEGMQYATIDNMPAPLKTAYLEVAPDKDRLQVMFDRDKERMLAFADIPDDDLRTIKAPALLIVADRDVVTSEHTLEMSHLIPGARLVILPGVHGSFIGEVGAVEPGSKLPEMTVGLVEEFLG